MKALLYGIGAFFLSSWQVYSQAPFHVYEPILLKSYLNMPGEKNLVSRDIQGYNAASAAEFIENAYDLPLVLDPLQARVVTIGDDYNITNSRAFNFEVSKGIFVFDDYIFSIAVENNVKITITNLDGTLLNVIEDVPSSFNPPRGVFFYQNMLFLHDQDRRIASVWFKDGLKEKPTILDEGATKKMVLDNLGQKFSDLRIDDKDRLFLYDELVTRDYATFRTYFVEKNGGLAKIGLAQDLSANPEKFSNSIVYLGKDAKGNWYWGGGNGAAVFDPSGRMIDYFIFDSDNYGRGSPYVSPGGDIYSLSWKWKEKEIKLSLVKNIWDQTIVVGISNDSGARVRSSPDLGASILTVLKNRGMHVAVLGQTKNSTTIDGKSSPWYKVRLQDGRVGWVFGAFLDIAK